MIAKKYNRFTPIFKQSGIIAVFISLISLSVLGLSSALAQEPVVEAEQCDAVATLYNDTICVSDIEPDEEKRADIERKFVSDPLLMRKQIDQVMTENLRHAIWITGINNKFGQDAATPSDEEIQLYAATLKSAMNNRYENNKKLVTLLEKLLAENKYSEENHMKLDGILKAAQISIRFYEARDDFGTEMPDEFSKMADDAAFEIASKFVRNWKINKILYEHYGGRLVAAEHNMMEPLDAHIGFITDMKHEGNLDILDATYANIIDDLIKYLNSRHIIISKDNQDIYKNYFSAIDWHLKHRGTLGEFERSKAKLLAVPTLP